MNAGALFVGDVPFLHSHPMRVEYDTLGIRSELRGVRIRSIDAKLQSEWFARKYKDTGIVLSEHILAVRTELQI
jgi:hypothetical protein